MCLFWCLDVVIYYVSVITCITLYCVTINESEKNSLSVTSYRFRERCFSLIEYTMARRPYSFANVLHSLSSLCRLIWKNWTYEIFVTYILPDVCLRLSLLSALFICNICVFICPRATYQKAATHEPWCMPGSLTHGGGENVPDIPDACATRNFTDLTRGPYSTIIRTISD